MKFRAWDASKMRWVIQNDLVHVALNGNVTHCSDSGVSSRNDLIVMQYTGLKDKNGVEIYEGDILEGDASSMDYPLKAKVYWDDEYGMWKADQYDYNEICEYELWSWLMEYQYINVIGNIHENPELLTEARS